MASTIAAVAMIVVLAGWHLRTRRHANWRSSSDARFYITTAYPFIAVAVYCLVDSSKGTDWEWALGQLWAFVAMVFLVLGFNTLNQPARQAEPSVERPPAQPTQPPLAQRNSARDITTR